MKNLKQRKNLKQKQKVPKTSAQKIRDYLIKKYGSSKNIFIRGKTFTDVQVSKMWRGNKKK